MALDKTIRKYRLKKGLTQQDVADYLNISQSTYNNYESGTHPVSSKHLPHLAVLFEIGIEDFFDKVKGVDKPNNHDNSSDGNAIVINVSDNSVAEKLYKSINKLIILLSDK